MSAAAAPFAQHGGCLVMGRWESAGHGQPGSSDPPGKVSKVGGGSNLFCRMGDDGKTCCFVGLELGSGVSGWSSWFMMAHDGIAVSPNLVTPCGTLEGWVNLRESLRFDSGTSGGWRFEQHEPSVPLPPPNPAWAEEKGCRAAFWG